MTTPLLEVRGLHTVFHTEAGAWPAVSGWACPSSPARSWAWSVNPARANRSPAFHLRPDRYRRGDRGRVLFKGLDTCAAWAKSECASCAAASIAMIFQDPLMTLNPVLRIEEQMLEAIQTHAPVPRAQALQRCVQALEMVGIPAAASRLRSYPHRFSGGMPARGDCHCHAQPARADHLRQATTALDVTIQGQILYRMQDLPHTARRWSGSRMTWA